MDFQSKWFQPSLISHYVVKIYNIIIMNTRTWKLEIKLGWKHFDQKFILTHMSTFFLIFLFSPGCFSYCLLRFPILGQIPTGATNKITTCDAVFVFNMIKSKECSKIISEWFEKEWKIKITEKKPNLLLQLECRGWQLDATAPLEDKHWWYWQLSTR